MLAELKLLKFGRDRMGQKHCRFCIFKNFGFIAKTVASPLRHIESDAGAGVAKEEPINLSVSAHGPRLHRDRIA